MRKIQIIIGASLLTTLLVLGACGPTPAPAPPPEVAPTYTRNYPNIASTDKMLVGAFYYPWYSPNRHWREGYANSPIRGEYNSRDQNVINAHIDEATGHGIDFFVMSWWGPKSWEDITLRDYFLKAQLVSDIKIVILYETVGSLRVEDGKVNLDDEINKRILIDDFKYLGENYFGHPSYLMVDGKPVVFIYLSRIFSGNIEGTLARLRQESRQNGYELFLIGDEVYWQSPFDESQKNRIKLYDAITAYNMHASVPDIDVDFVSKVSEHYKKWKTVADQLGIEFVPDVLPGFDDTKVRTQEKHYVIRRTAEKFDSFIQSVLPLVGNKNILLITSYNEWHEGTEIEPSNEHGASYLGIIKDRVAEYR